MQRVLYVNPSADVSGAENSLLALIQGLDRSRYEPLLVCPSAGRLTARAEAAQIGYLTCPIPSLALTGSPSEIGRDMAGVVPAARRWQELIHRENIDLVHINSFRVAIPCSLGARLARRPVIWQVRDFPRTALTRRLVRRSAAVLADRVIAVSHAVAQALIDGKTRSPRVCVIYNGIALADMQPSTPRDAIRADLGITPDTVLVGAFGQLTPWKGYQVLLQAMALLRGDNPKIKLLIAGAAIAPGFRVPREGASYTDRLLDLRRELGLEESVQFLGYREDIPNLLGALDIYAHAAVLPDPLPRSVLEGMSAGLPVIAPANGGIPEMIRDQESGWLYPAGDVSALVKALHTLARDPAERAALGQAARHRCATCFSLATHVAQVQALYKEVALARRN